MTDTDEEMIACPQCGGVGSGVEIQGVYDGVLFWQCNDCNHRWHRFVGDNRLHDLAQKYIEGMSL